MIKKFRKKPVVIEAIQFTSTSFNECCKFIGEDNLNDGTLEEEEYIGIITPEGDHNARHGDWIIKGIKGEFYPCKPDIFEQTYEEVTNEKQEEKKEHPKAWKYKCGHESTCIITDSNPLSISAWLEWKDSVGVDGDMSMCWNCWCSQK